MSGFLKISSGVLEQELSVLELTETTEPTSSASIGKFYASSADNRPHFKGSDDSDYDLTGGYWERSSTYIYPTTSGDWVGIGTETPESALELSGTDATNGSLTITRYNTTGGGYIYMRKSRGTEGTPTVVLVDDAIGYLYFQGYDGNAFSPGAMISGRVDDTPSSGAVPSRLQFDVYDGSSWINALRITHDGYLELKSTGTRKIISSSGALTLATETSGDLNISSAAEITFDDANRVASGFSAAIKLSETNLEWNTFETNFGEVSIINAINQAGGTRVDNTDVDAPWETIDSFDDTLCTAAYWHYVLSKGTNYRSGLISACWNPTTDEYEFREIHTDDIGDTSDVELSVDISSNLVRLRATTASNDWSVRTKRFFVDG